MKNIDLEQAKIDEIKNRIRKEQEEKAENERLEKEALRQLEMERKIEKNAQEWKTLKDNWVIFVILFLCGAIPIAWFAWGAIKSESPSSALNNYHYTSDEAKYFDYGECMKNLRAMHSSKRYEQNKICQRMLENLKEEERMEQFMQEVEEVLGIEKEDF